MFSTFSVTKMLLMLLHITFDEWLFSELIGTRSFVALTLQPLVWSYFLSQRRKERLVDLPIIFNPCQHRMKRFDKIKYCTLVYHVSTSGSSYTISLILKMLLWFCTNNISVSTPWTWHKLVKSNYFVMSTKFPPPSLEHPLVFWQRDILGMQWPKILVETSVWFEWVSLFNSNRETIFSNVNKLKQMQFNCNTFDGLPNLLYRLHSFM